MPSLNIALFITFLLVGFGVLKGQNSQDDYQATKSLIQQNKINRAKELLDSIKNITPKQETNKQHINILNELSRYYRNKGVLDSAILYKKEAWSIVSKQNYDENFRQYLIQLAYYNWEAGNYSNALKYTHEALRNIEKVDSNRRAPIHNILGITYLELGDYERSLNHFNKAVELANDSPDDSYKGTLYANIGRVYFKMSDLKKALEFYRRGSQIEIKHNHHREAGRSFADMGVIYTKLEKFDKAKTILDTARMQNKLANDDIGFIRTNIATGKLYMATNRFNKAENHFKRAVQQAKTVNTQKELMEAYYGLYNTYAQSENYEKAFEFLHKYYNKYKQLYSIQEIIKIENLQYKLALQEEKNQNQKAQIEKQKTITKLLFIVVILIFITSAALIILLIRSRRSRMALKTKNIEIESQKENLVKLNQAFRKAKERAENSEALKDQFLRNISHEIRTPLNGIIGFSSILAQPDVSHEERRNYQGIIEQNAKTLLSAIEDIIDIAKIRTHQIKVYKEKFDINSLMNELQKIFYFEKAYRHKENIDIIIEQDTDNQQMIYSDQQKIRKIIILLTNNALKFTKKGYIKMSYTIRDSIITFSIEDTGIGISVENQKLIFESFRQIDGGMNRYYQGIGLGLTIAKAFTEILQGKLWFESTPNVGTKFYFSIPLKN